MEDIAKWFVLGLGLAALMSVIIPDDFFINYSSGYWMNMILILLTSIPLYICATGSVPIAAVLIAKGLPVGIALVFLMAGPATNIATITLIGKTLGKRTLFVYLFSIIFGAILSGVIIDFFISADFLKTQMSAAMCLDGHNHSLPYFIHILSSVILLVFILRALLKRYLFIHQPSSTTLPVNTIRVKAHGMTCNQCKLRIEQQVSTLSNVQHVEANPATDEVLVTGRDINLEELEELINKMGYRYQFKESKEMSPE